MNPMLVAKVIEKVDVKKTAMYIGGALLLVILFLYVRKKIREAKEDRRDDEYLQLVQNSVTATDLNYSDAEYLAMADALEQYFGDTGLSAGLLGVNQKGVYSVMEKMKSNSDLSRLEVVFAKRNLKDLSIASPMFSALVKAKPYTLNEAMTQLLTTGELKKVNKILAKNGLTKTY